MAVHISQVESYKHYGRCIKLENGKLEILVTTDIGPRIIYFGAVGGENMFFNDEADECVTKGALYERVYGEGTVFHFYGGHRMWLAPQLMMHTSYPDNAPVPYEIIENGVILKPEAQEILGMQPVMKVVMSPDKSEIEVEVTYRNISKGEKSYAVWQISQFDVGGVAIVPFSAPRRRFDPNHVFTDEELLTPFPPRAQISSFMGGFTEDPRFRIDAEYFTLKQDPGETTPIKLGTPNLSGYAMYANKGYVATMEFPYDDTKTYTDRGCSFEIFTANYFLELESLGAYETVQPGETVSHTVKLSLQKAKMPVPDVNDRKAVKAFAEAHRE